MEGRVTILPRHRVSALRDRPRAVIGATGDILAPSGAARGLPTSREVVGSFEVTAGSTVVSSGGIGGNHDLVRAQWPARLGTPPASMLTGVPAYVDGSMVPIAQSGGARLVNMDRMWHYVEGIQNWNPVWPSHGIRILPGPSSVWLDATGKRLPVPLFPGYDTLGTLAHLRQTGMTTRGSCCPARSSRRSSPSRAASRTPISRARTSLLLTERLGKGPMGPVQAFMDKGDDFVVRDNLADLVAGMQALPGGDALDAERVIAEVEARDREIENDFTKDAQIAMLRSARAYRGDRLIRTATPHRLQDPKAGPLIAVKLHVLTRKSLGGIETDLHGRALGAGRRTHPGAVRGGRGERLRRRRDARLPRARGHLRGWMPLLRPPGGPGGRRVGAEVPRRCRAPVLAHGGQPDGGGGRAPAGDRGTD